MKRRDAKILARRLCRRGYLADAVFINAKVGWAVANLALGCAAAFKDWRRLSKLGPRWAKLTGDAWPVGHAVIRAVLLRQMSLTIAADMKVLTATTWTARTEGDKTILTPPAPEAP